MSGILSNLNRINIKMTQESNSQMINTSIVRNRPNDLGITVMYRT